MYFATDLRAVAAIGGRFYADGRELELEPVYVMGWVVNNLTIVGGFESILEVISNVCDANDEVVSSRELNNQMKCRCC